MLLRLDLNTKIAERIRGIDLKSIGIDERAFQEILYRSLDNLIPDDELLLLMQSRRWQEEPDLMAIDKDGNLFIFELKAWESRSDNLLQVLRYGQIFGNHNYEDMNTLFRKFEKDGKELKDAFKVVFGKDMDISKFNSNQVFVVVTNGIDYKTREAIQYWRIRGLDVRPWIYRIYKEGNSEPQIEISAFSTEDNPYEDLAEGYYILNTNYRNDEEDHNSMLSEKIASAYFSPWKNKIKNLSKGDIVFLYQSGIGIVAKGKVCSTLKKRNYHGNPKYIDEEYYVKLDQFNLLENPLKASEIKEITEVNYRFMSTMFGIDKESGGKLVRASANR